jgi:hypothetical protein
MQSFVEAGEDRRWIAFLSRWSLLGGVVILGLIAAFVAGLLPAGAGGDLPPKYFELAAAMESPSIYRLTIALDIVTWVTLGGFFVGLGAMLFRRAPVSGALVAACGVGQVAGLAGAFMRLNGTIGTAELYEGASPDRQEALLQSYAYLQSAYFSHFNAGTLLWGAALLMAASVLWSADGFPRWVAVVMVVTGVLRISESVLGIATGVDLGFLILPELLLLIVIFFSVSWTFRRRASGAIPEGSGVPG